MSWVAVAIGGGALVGAIGSNMAANTQANAQENAANTQLGMFNTINAQEQPFIQAGYGATNVLNQLLGIGAKTGPDWQAYLRDNPDVAASTLYGSNPAQHYQDYGKKEGRQISMLDPNASASGPVGNTGLPAGYLTSKFAPTQEQLNDYPGYQFALQTGGQAIRNAATPGVGALSGAALKDLMAFNVGTANQFYGQYFNQDQQEKNNIFSRLSGIAGLGQNAASNVGTSGTSLGTGIAQAQAAAGGSQAAGIAGATNSIGNAGVPLAYLLSQQNNGGGGNGAGQSANLNASTRDLFGS